MSLDSATATVLWQLALSLIGGLLIAVAAVAASKGLHWPASRPGFWWAALALVLIPAPAAHLLPEGWTPSTTAWQWVDHGVQFGDTPTPPEPPVAASPVTLDPGDTLLALWLGGVLWMAASALRGRLRLRRLLQQCPPLPVGGLPGPRSRRLATALGRRGIRLLACPLPLSPFAIRGRIVLPRALLTRLDDAQCWLLLRHEATHLRLQDPLWHALLALLVALHWFNPAARLLAGRLRLATELRCDARAVGRRKHMRRAYAEAYLQALRMSATRALPCPAAAFSPQDQGTHTMRIGHILSSPPRPGKSRPLALALLALGAGLALTAAQAAALGSNQPAAGKAPEFRGPIIEGRISSQFGTQRPKLSSEPHRGIDLTAPRGTPVRAPADGVVLTAEAPFSEAPRYGSVVVLDHGNGWRTLYAHLDSIAVRPGDSVRAGDTLGGLGSTGVATGPHVHVEVHKDGERVDPATVIDGLVMPR